MKFQQYSAFAIIDSDIDS